MAVPANLASNKLIFSKAKAEKVVKPPQNPVPSSSFQCSACVPVFFMITAKIKPSKKDPRKFTVKVPYGKREFNLLSTVIVVTYRAMLPKNPPAPTKRILYRFIIIARSG
jgi:hypothetical protein